MKATLRAGEVTVTIEGEIREDQFATLVDEVALVFAVHSDDPVMTVEAGLEMVARRKEVEP
jgi:hypothetical protein